MSILTNKPTTELEQINKALEKEGLSKLKIESEIDRIGEGAWHHAYLVNRNRDPYVLRLPKKMAYEKEVLFNYDDLMADYAGTKAYYKQANIAKKGICPDYFNFLVSEELTYMIESYAGKTVGLKEQTLEQSKRYGAELGEIFSAIEELESPLSGLGYLKWTEGNLAGEFDMEIQSFLLQETEEYQEELDSLLNSQYEFDKRRVRQIGKELIQRRSIEGERIVFTNQDTSPENIIFTKDRVHIIDPYPILYTGTSLAANFVFNYQTTFPTFYNTKRYGKQRYNLYTKQLREIANGFTSGYVQESIKKQESLHIEVFLKLVTMAHGYMKLEQESMNREQEIRYGNKKQVEARLDTLLRQLENYSLEYVKSS